MIRSFFFIIIISSYCSEVNAQWQLINEIPKDSITFYNHSCNSGQTYFNMKFLSPANSYYWWYFDCDPSTVHASLDEGKFYSSLDSCKTRFSISQNINPLISNPYSGISNINIHNSRDAIYWFGPTMYGQFFKRSIDLGLTWNGFQTYLGSNVLPSMISSYDRDWGYGANSLDGKFFRIDHDTCYQILNYNKPTNWELFNFINDSIGIAATEDTIFNTTNGGNLWDTVQIDTSGEFNTLFSINDSIWWAVKNNNTIYRTIDYGHSWQNFTTLNFFPENLNYYQLDTIYCLHNAPNIYNDSTAVSHIMRSGDGGITWDSFPFYQGYKLIELKMFSANFGYLLARKFTFYNTTYYIYQFSGGTINIQNPTQKHFLVYPNPFIQDIKFSGVRNASIEIIDRMGKVVYAKQKILDDDLNVHLDVPAGLYFTRVLSNNGFSTYRIICLK